MVDSTQGKIGRKTVQMGHKKEGKKGRKEAVCLKGSFKARYEATGVFRAAKSLQGGSVLLREGVCLTGDVSNVFK